MHIKLTKLKKIESSLNWKLVEEANHYIMTYIAWVQMSIELIVMWISNKEIEINEIEKRLINLEKLNEYKEKNINDFFIENYKGNKLTPSDVAIKHLINKLNLINLKNNYSVILEMANKILNKKKMKRMLFSLYK